MRAHFLSEHLVGVTLINHFNTIIKDSMPEIIGLQIFLSCRRPRIGDHHKPHYGNCS
jgi:hypothetical protein